MNETIAALSWALLELKFAYYYPGNLHETWKELIVPDAVYDQLEDLYRKLCADHGVTPNVYDMVGFKFTRPCCALVADKLTKEKGNNESVYRTVTQQRATKKAPVPAPAPKKDIKEIFDFDL
jgi:hypothetical protein